MTPSIPIAPLAPVHPNCLQRVTVRGDGGVFMLRNETARLSTLDMPRDAPASLVQSELERLYGPGNVTVTGDDGGPFRIEFCGDLAGTHVDLVTADADYLVGENRAVVVEMARAAPVSDLVIQRRIDRAMQRPGMQTRLHDNARLTAIVRVLIDSGVMTESDWYAALAEAIATCEQAMREAARDLLETASPLEP